MTLNSGQTAASTDGSIQINENIELNGGNFVANVGDTTAGDDTFTLAATNPLSLLELLVMPVEM